MHLFRKTCHGKTHKTIYSDRLKRQVKLWCSNYSKRQINLCEPSLRNLKETTTRACPHSISKSDQPFILFAEKTGIWVRSIKQWWMVSGLIYSVKDMIKHCTLLYPRDLLHIFPMHTRDQLVEANKALRKEALLHTLKPLLKNFWFFSSLLQLS